MAKHKEKQEGATGRDAYAIAWRSKRIAQLEEEIGGERQRSALLEALLSCVLLRYARGDEGERRIRIGRAELSTALGKWRAESRIDGEDYEVVFHLSEEAADAATGT